jgi:spore maturation protein SpmA
MGFAVDIVISFLISLMGSVTMFLGLVKVAEKLVNKGLDIYIIDMRR